MVEGILAGMRVIEGSAYIAGPIAGLTLAQMGADVIRFDPIGGGPDHRRWPLTVDGHSLYWAGLNKGKRSIAVDLRSGAGRELVTALITDGRPGGGIYASNLDYPWLDYESLRLRREDLLMLRLTGDGDGRVAFDYTVNAAVGYPAVTGPTEHDGPANHVLPAWDVIAGGYAATALLAADAHRRASGQGQLIRLSLTDVALATVGNLGHIAEAQVNGTQRGRNGNFIYGTFGSDFATSDGRRVMVAALTRRQWRALREATGTVVELAELERSLGLDLSCEGDRFRARERIADTLRPWFAARPAAAVGEALDRHGVPWGPYQTFMELVADDPRCTAANPLFADVEHPGIGRHLTPGVPFTFSHAPNRPPARSPLLGEHTDELLQAILGLSDLELGRLHDGGVIDGPRPTLGVPG